jgi:hypothetical protein
MLMDKLDKLKELTDITFDHEGAHLAVCHVSQGYSANMKPDALLLKSSTPITKAVVASLEDVYGKEAVVKISAANKRKHLEMLVEEKLKESFPLNEYIYAYVVDYNEDMVVFEFENELWAVDYTMTDDETGSIVLGDEPTVVMRADVYVAVEDGETLIKAVAFKELPSKDVNKSEDGDIKEGDLDETPLNKEETLMSNPETEAAIQEDVVKSEGEAVVNKEVDMTETSQVAELLKSSEAQELLKAMAAEMAATQFEELQKAAQKDELVKNTSEIVKGFSGVAEDQVESIVKCLVDTDQAVAGVLLKAMSDMQEALVAKSAEVEEVKKEFGTQQNAVEAKVEVTEKSGNRTQELASVVNKLKNK